MIAVTVLSVIYMCYVLAKNTEIYRNKPVILLAVIPIVCMWFYCVIYSLGFI